MLQKGNSVAKTLLFSLTPRSHLTNLRSVIWLLALLVSACASTGKSRGDEEVVGERAVARWNAIIAGDLKSAYELVSPAGRTVVTQEGYKSSFKPGFHKAAQLRGVKCESPEVCVATFDIEYEYMGRRTTTPLSERWIKQDSNWWYLLDR